MKQRPASRIAQPETSRAIAAGSESIPFIPPPPIDAQLGTMQTVQASSAAIVDLSIAKSVRMMTSFVDPVGEQDGGRQHSLGDRRLR